MNVLTLKKMKAIAKDKSIEERIRKGKVRTENIVKKKQKKEQKR